MTNAILRDNSIATPFYINEAGLRIKIKAELLQLREEIDYFKNNGFNDSMTERIDQWQNQFYQAISSNINEQAILDQYIHLLQELLVDAASHTPLDVDTYLGTDGKTYSHMSLSLYQNSVPEEFKNRSPLNPKDPILFTTVPHLVVKTMIMWLKKHDANLPHFSFLAVDPVQEKVQQIRRKQLQRKQQREERTRESLQEITRLQQQMDKQIIPLFKQINRDTQGNAQINLGKIEVIKNQNDKAFDELHQATCELQKSITELEKSNEDLRVIKGQLTTVERNLIQTQIAINEVRKAQKETKKSWIKEFREACAVIGPCIFLTWATCGILSSVNTAFIPIPNGLKIGLSIPC